MAKSLGPEKTKMWNALSKFIRISECLKTTGLPFLGVCFTCKKRFHMRFLEAGHLIAGRSAVLLVCRKFIHIQCQICNQYYHGRTKRFRRYMDEIHGVEYMDKWVNKLKGWSKMAKFKNKDIAWAVRTERYDRMYRSIMRKHGYKTWTELLQN